VITVHAFEGGKYTTHAAADVGALLAAGATLWIDAEGDDGVTALLTDVLRLHPLAVEDIVQERPTPKVESYGDYLYIVAHGVVRGKEDPETLETVELDLVVSKKWVFTHHTGPLGSIEGTREELQRSVRALERGPAWVAHAILDRMIDLYLPLVDAFDDDVDEVEAAVIENPTPTVLQRIFRLKRGLQRLRRVALSQREVLHRLSRGEFELIPEAALPFYRDVFDHFVRVADLADSYRELLSGALDAYLSVVSNKMNEVMKALTLVATILLPLTFLAGVYGMNFEHMPELHWRYGYLGVWILFIVVAVGMVWWFKRRRWL
jgi:magnesium transporter